MDTAGGGMDRGRECPAGPRYAIRVQGHLDNRWCTWFEGMTLTLEPAGVTRLEGRVKDQPALHGILNKLRDLALPLLSVEQLAD